MKKITKVVAEKTGLKFGTMMAVDACSGLYFGAAKDVINKNNDKFVNVIMYTAWIATLIGTNLGINTVVDKVYKDIEADAIREDYFNKE